MSKEKLILDIRYFESDIKNISGNPLPSYIGKIFSLHNEIDSFSSRVARKLREYGFVTGDFDHIYINLTTVIPEGEINISSRRVEKWLKYFDVGFDKNRINALSEVEKISEIEKVTFDVLNLICKDEQRNIIERVKAEIASRKSEIEILHKYKETKSYEIKLTYQIKPNCNENSLAKIYYTNKKTGETFQECIELQFYEDIFFLASSVSYSKGCILLKPRTSYRAELHNKRYNVPISIPVQQNV